MRAICGDQLWDDSQDFILESAWLQVFDVCISANPEMLPVPTAPGFKAPLDLHPEFSMRVVVQFELK